VDDLAREQFREKLRLWAADHALKQSEIKTWAGNATVLLQKKETCNSIAEANKNLANLEAYEADKSDWTNINVAALKKLGAETIAAEYKTSLSHYKYPTPQDITAREQVIDSQWEELAKLAAEKKKVLDEDLAREIKKEELRLKFANLAGDFQRWEIDQSKDVKSSHFGFTLEEVEAHSAILDQKDEQIKKIANEKTTACNQVLHELSELKVTTNVYTQHNSASLAAINSSLQSALHGRREAYAKELARQKANDDLCKKFADLVTAFDRKLESTKDGINSSTKSLEDQQADVQGFIRSAESDGDLKALQDLQAKIDGAGITNNRHSQLTAADAENDWKQYLAFLSSKNSNLTKAIEHKKLRGITPEQHKEIEDQFTKFDKNKNGELDVKEFRACLYSLGEEKRKTEVQAVMDKYNTKDAKVIPHAGFTNFMIDQLGDTDTQEEIVQGFKLMARGAEHVPESEMTLVLPDEDIAFFKKTAPPVKDKEGHFDYVPWTQEVYSR